MNKEKEKLSVRDLVTIGILTAVFIAVFWTSGMIVGMNPFTWPFLTSIVVVPAGLVFMLLLSRVPKRGTFFITGTVTAIVFLLTGHYWPMAAYGPLAFAMLGLSAAGGFAGAMLGRVVMKKSFQKAGLI